MHDIVFILAVPRSGSTATMLTLQQSKLFQSVFCEPNSDQYYQKKNIPGMHKEAMNFKTYAQVKADILAAAQKGRVLVKDMVHHFYEDIANDEAFCQQVKFVLLIRDPLPAICSHLTANLDASEEEIGFEALFKFAVVLQNWGQTYQVIDYADILVQPDRALKMLCENLAISPHGPMGGIEPDSDMKDQMEKFREWYENALKSTKIEPQASEYKVGAEHPRVKELEAYHRPYYNILKSQAIRFYPKSPVLLHYTGPRAPVQKQVQDQRKVSNSLT